MNPRESRRKPDGQGKPTEGQFAEPKTEPKTYRLGETIFPFRNGIRRVRKGERTWTAASYVSRDDFPIEGLGLARVELAQSLTTDSIFPSKVVLKRGGEYVLSEPAYEFAVVVRYDDPEAVDQHLTCHVSIGTIKVRAHNEAYGAHPEIKEPNAGFSQWEQKSGKVVNIHVMLDTDYEQAENQVLQDFSFRIERPQPEVE